jgi:hypothetical protein
VNVADLPTAIAFTRNWASFRMLFDWLITGQTLKASPSGEGSTQAENPSPPSPSFATGR